MSSSNPAFTCPKLVISNWLFDIGVPPLSRPPSYSVKNRVSHPASNLAGYSPRSPVRNPVSYVDRYPVSYRESYPEGNSASCRASCRESCSPSCSAVCPANRSADSPESNLPDNSEESWERYSESYLASCSPGAFPSPTSVDKYDLTDSLKLAA